MEPNRVEQHIDKKIYQALCDGESMQYVIDDLLDCIDRFSKRKDFVKISRRYIMNNWTRINFKKRYTTYYVMHSTRRLEDIRWILENKDKFPKLGDDKLFNLIKLKDRLKFEYI